MFSWYISVNILAVNHHLKTTSHLSIVYHYIMSFFISLMDRVHRAKMV